MIERLLHKALYHHTYEDVATTLPVDSLAYFTAINHLHAILKEKEFYTKPLKGVLSELPEDSEVFTSPVYQKSSDDTRHYILIAKVVLAYKLKSKGSILYYFDVFGGHNKKVLPKADLKDKSGTILIPFDLVGTVKKELMPIDPVSALIQNPLHECFSYKLSPSPATSFAIEHDLDRQMAFMTHPKMMFDFFDLPKEQLDSLYFDTRLALDLLKSKYNIHVSEDAIKEVAELDEKLHNNKGFACIEIN